MADGVNPFEVALECFEAAGGYETREESASGPSADEISRYAGMITEAGAYPGIPNHIYHSVELCPEHSIHGSGLVTIEEKSCAHYWLRSIHNPERFAQTPKRHFALGHLLHDILLFKGMLPSEYHIVPDGFNARHTSKWADEMPAYRAAVAAGMNVLTESEFNLGRDMAEACDKHPLATALLTSGEPEVTIAAQDPKTNRWMLTRTDILPETKEIIPDVKSVASAHPEDYEKSATRWGYFQWAAHCLDILDLAFGEAKRQFVHIAIEKAKPHPVEIYALDDGDIHEARMLNRRALNMFDRCLTTGEWPAYSRPDNPILPLLLAPWKRRQIQLRVDNGELSYDL